MSVKEERLRAEGMSFCLRYLEAHDGDVDALKAEIKRRGAAGIPIGVSPKQEEDFCRRVRENCLDTILALTLATLHDAFGFGRIRANRFKEFFNDSAELLGDDCINWTEILQGIDEQLGIKMRIRWYGDKPVQNQSEKEGT